MTRLLASAEQTPGAGVNGCGGPPSAPPQGCCPWAQGPPWGWRKLSLTLLALPQVRSVDLGWGGDCDSPSCYFCLWPPNQQFPRTQTCFRSRKLGGRDSHRPSRAGAQCLGLRLGGSAQDKLTPPPPPGYQLCLSPSCHLLPTLSCPCSRHPSHPGRPCRGHCAPVWGWGAVPVP